MNKACERCKGACCESIILQVNAPSGDVARWVQFHGTLTKNGIEFPCKCSKLQDGKCSIYEDRPQVCKTFKVGSPECLYALHRKRSESEVKAIVELMEE